jgi:AraC-like DNA-binding protein
MASTLPVKYLHSLLKLSPLPPEALQLELEALGIDPSMLESGKGEVSTEQYGRLFIHLVRGLQTDLAGRRGDLSGLLSFSTYRMMFEAMVHAATLREALTRAAIYFERFQPDAETFHIETVGDLARCRFDIGGETDAPVTAANFCMGRLDWLPGVSGRLLAMATWHRVAGWFIGSYIDLERVELAAAGRPGKDYRDLFGVPVVFGADTNAFYFHPRYLDFPVVQGEASLAAMLQSFPARLMELEQLNSSLGNRVLGLIGTDFNGELPTLPEIAERLLTTTATLHRRLKAEGTSWQQLKDEARREAAMNYIDSGEYSNVQVAEMMGFSDPSTFYRAFRKWTGQTPQQYRQQGGGSG